MYTVGVSMINRSNIMHIDSLGQTRMANCWGSTQFALGFIKKPRWEDQDGMEKFLKFNTVKAFGNRVQGDIMVMRDEAGKLVHTAIYDEANVWWHKPGSNSSEFAFASKIKSQYEHDYSKIEYRRFTSLHFVKKRKETKTEKRFTMSLYRIFIKLAKASWI